MLEARNLAKTFNPRTANEVRALNGVDLAVEDGSWVVVVGTNGSGKSSLLNAIAGAFFVDAGTISLGGQDLTVEIRRRRQTCVCLTFTIELHSAAVAAGEAQDLGRCAQDAR